MEIRKQPITVLKPIGGDEELKALEPVIKSGWGGKGPKVAEFEKRFAELVGSKYAIAVTSNTHGLDLVLKLFGIKDSIVLSPTMSFASTCVVPMGNNNESVLVDCEEDTLCLSPKHVDGLLSKYGEKVKVIICVNMAGIAANIDEIRNICKKHKREDILIIEDCAHSCYTKGAGTKGDIAIWSFQAVKTLPIGDGGMLTYNLDGFHDAVKPATGVGIKKTTFDRTVSDSPGYVWDYIIDSIGWKYYMIDILATIGLVQMDKLENNLKRRREIQKYYKENLIPYVPITAPLDSETVQYYCARVDDETKRDDLIQYLADKNIHTSVHFKPIHGHPAFYQHEEYPVADKVGKHLISLPVHPGLTDEDLEYVVYWIKEFFKE